ncbi:MAG: beta-N-acetylglucosaminidase domain-containing protein [Jatrophihabitans sp.]
MYRVRTVPLRGAMECFYGEPWSPEQRLAVVLESARWGMNFFVYGPSGDAHTGVAWREPYPAAELAEFGHLARAAADAGVTLCWRISASAPLDPRRGIVFSDEQQRRDLLDRVSDVVATGFGAVLLTFDDVEHGLFHAADRAAFDGVSNPAATAHSLLASELAGHLADAGADLAICPTRYWGLGAHAYLRALDAALPPGVPMCWTGPRISSRRIDSRAAAERRGDRPIWLWDNYPVNDWDGVDPDTAEPVQRRLFLDPLTGRALDLTGQIDAYLVNCGATARAALPAIATAAQWAVDAGSYDADRSIVDAIRAYDDDDGSLAFLATTACSTALASREPHPLVSRSWAFLASSSIERQSDGPALAEALSAAAVKAEMALSSRSPVVAAVGWYSEQLVLQLRAAEQAVGVLVAEASADEGRLADCAQWLADRRHQLDQLMRTAVLDSGLLPLIETGRGLAGPPVPPHDV